MNSRRIRDVAISLCNDCDLGASRDDLVAKLGQPSKVITTFALPGIRTQPYLYTLASGTTLRFDFDGTDAVRTIFVLSGAATFVESGPDSNSHASATTAAVSNETQQFLALISTYRGKAFCAPSTATVGDAVKVVSQAVKSHAEWQGRYSDQQALQALADAYPCNVNLNTPINQLAGRTLQATPGGDYATIDTKADISIIQQLRSGDQKDRGSGDRLGYKDSRRLRSPLGKFARPQSSQQRSRDKHRSGAAHATSSSVAGHRGEEPAELSSRHVPIRSRRPAASHLSEHHARKIERYSPVRHIDDLADSKIPADAAQ